MTDPIPEQHEFRQGVAGSIFDPVPFDSWERNVAEGAYCLDAPELIPSGASSAEPFVYRE